MSPSSGQSGPDDPKMKNVTPTSRYGCRSASSSPGSVGITSGYGMTEVTGFVTYTSPEDDPETIARQGLRYLKEVEARL